MRKNYRKDYLCDCYRSTFPAGQTVVYEAVTGLFRQSDGGRRIADAEALLKETLHGNKVIGTKEKIFLFPLG